MRFSSNFAKSAHLGSSRGGSCLPEKPEFAPGTSARGFRGARGTGVVGDREAQRPPGPAEAPAQVSGGGARSRRGGRGPWRAGAGAGGVGLGRPRLLPDSSPAPPPLRPPSLGPSLRRGRSPRPPRPPAPGLQRGLRALPLEPPRRPRPRPGEDGGDGGGAGVRSRSRTVRARPLRGRAPRRRAPCAPHAAPRRGGGAAAADAAGAEQPQENPGEEPASGQQLPGAGTALGTELGGRGEDRGPRRTRGTRPRASPSPQTACPGGGRIRKLRLGEAELRVQGHGNQGGGRQVWPAASFSAIRAGK